MLTKRQEAVTRMESDGRAWKGWMTSAHNEINLLIKSSKAMPIKLDLTFASIGADESTKVMIRDDIIRELKEGGWRISPTPTETNKNLYNIE